MARGPGAGVRVIAGAQRGRRLVVPAGDAVRPTKDIVREAATTTGMPFSVDRWLGGTLTNYETVKKSIAKYKKYQAMETSGEMQKLPRKEESAIKTLQY